LDLSSVPSFGFFPDIIPMILFRPPLNVNRKESSRERSRTNLA
jgi:hypothetical protein